MLSAFGFGHGRLDARAFAATAAGVSGGNLAPVVLAFAFERLLASLLQVSARLLHLLEQFLPPRQFLGQDPPLGGLAWFRVFGFGLGRLARQARTAAATGLSNLSLAPVVLALVLERLLPSALQTHARLLHLFEHLLPAHPFFRQGLRVGLLAGIGLLGPFQQLLHLKAQLPAQLPRTVIAHVAVDTGVGLNLRSVHTDCPHSQ